MKRHQSYALIKNPEQIANQTQDCEDLSQQPQLLLKSETNQHLFVHSKRADAESGPFHFFQYTVMDQHYEQLI